MTKPRRSGRVLRITMIPKVHGFLLSVALATGAVACTHAPPPPDPKSEILAAVATAHGGAGPWAVAGYRMGRAALAALGLPRGSFELEVTHFSPHQVQYTCIADGAAAATGASLGKLNLQLAEASEDATHTTYRNRSTGRSVTYRLTTAFRTRFLDVPRPHLAEAGRAVLELADRDIFELVE